MLALLTPLILPVLALHGGSAACQENPPDHPLGVHLDEQYTDDLDGLLERRYIRVLTVFNKTSFFVEKGRFYGFEFELLDDYEDYLNRGPGRGQLGVVLEYIPCGRDELIDKLVGGYGDIVAAGMTITPERSERARFTIPYLTGISEVLVTHRDVAAPGTVEGLSGRSVHVRRSSSYHQSLERLNERFAREGREQVEIVAVGEELETEDILEMVNAGAIGMTVSDTHIAEIWGRLLDHIVIHDTVVLRPEVEIGWMVRRGNPELERSCNEFLRGRKRGTRLGNIYFKRYYRKTSWIYDPLGGGGRKNIQRYESLFRKYASRYGFDWRLIMAMAYQESKLDHSKRSGAGAVGMGRTLATG